MTTHQAADPARRAVLKRAALVGAATVWTAPVVQSLAAPAHASGTGSPPPDDVRGVRKGSDGDRVLGKKLPDTGADVVEVLATGAALVTGGAAATAYARRLRRPPTGSDGAA